MNPHPLQPYWTEKAKAAIHEQRLAGRHLGKAPLGYRNVTVDGKPVIEIDPDTAPLVREAFRLASQKRMSLRKILAELDRQGLRTKVRKKLSVSSLHKMLGNPFYVGSVRLDGELVQGAHKPLVTWEIFEKSRREAFDA